MGQHLGSRFLVALAQPSSGEHTITWRSDEPCRVDRAGIWGKRFLCSCVALGKSAGLSESPFPHMKKEEQVMSKIPFWFMILWVRIKKEDFATRQGNFSTGGPLKQWIPGASICQKVIAVPILTS